MTERSLFRLRSHITVSYPVSSQYSIYALYKPMVVPMTLVSDFRVIRFLSSASSIRHADVSNSGGFGVESDWNQPLRNRISLGVKTASDLTMFSDNARQGVWKSAYGEDVTIITFCAEMVAKFASNDYFASNIMLRSV
jgi:hypothetical protein